MRARERIIRERFAKQKCAHCGSPYLADSVVILARRSSAWMVMASCGSCQRQGVFVVSFPTTPPEHASQFSQTLSADIPIALDISPLSSPTRTSSASAFSETPFAPSPTSPLTSYSPINADDVNGMHEFLANFNGDFRALFQKPQHEG